MHTAGCIRASTHVPLLLVRELDGGMMAPAMRCSPMRELDVNDLHDTSGTALARAHMSFSSSVHDRGVIEDTKGLRHSGECVVSSSMGGTATCRFVQTSELRCAAGCIRSCQASLRTTKTLATRAAPRRRAHTWVCAPRRHGRNSVEDTKGSAPCQRGRGFESQGTDATKTTTRVEQRRAGACTHQCCWCVAGRMLELPG